MASQTENLTAAQLEAPKENAGKSTGPRTAPGKRRSSQNARKHGLYSNANFFWDAAIALGEDPRDFERLLKGLVLARQPADTLEMVLVEDIALLVWKKARLDRAEAAVQVCNLQKHDLERRKQFVQVGRDISDTLQSEVREKGLRTRLDAPGKFEQILSILDILVEMVEKNDFSPNMQEFLRGVYGEEPTLRGAGLYNNYFKLSEMEAGSQEFEDAKTLMRARLAEEISDVAQQYELFLHEHVENTRAARMAATAPSHAQWAAIIRQQNALHRQLQQKIRLLAEIQEKRKREEERFLDNCEASLRRNPSDAPRGGRHGASLTRGAGPASPEPACQPRACGVGYPQNETPRGGWQASNRKKILNRGNEPKTLVQTQELADTASSKRTPFCAGKMAIKAKKGGVSTQEAGGTGDSPAASGQSPDRCSGRRCHLRDVGGCKPQSFPRKRESTPQVFGNRLSLQTRFPPLGKLRASFSRKRQAFRNGSHSKSHQGRKLEALNAASVRRILLRSLESKWGWLRRANSLMEIASFLHPWADTEDARIIGKELIMSKSLTFSRVAVALAAPFFLGSLLTMGIKARLVFAAPAEPIPGALQGKPTEPSPIPAADLIHAPDLVKILQSPKGERPLLIYVGFRFPYTQAHLPGSEYYGPAANEAVVQQLRKRVQGLARSRFIVIYCGCCPWSHCPNVKPAYEALHNLGFTKLKVLYIPDNLGTDWVNRGYPVEKGA